MVFQQVKSSVDKYTVRHELRDDQWACDTAIFANIKPVASILAEKGLACFSVV